MPQPFVVPEGVVFLIEEDGVTIENQGDVVLHTDFGGRAFKRVISREGSIELHTGARAASLEAGGAITVGGALHAGSVQAGGALAVAGAAELGAVVAGRIAIEGALNAESVSSEGDVAVHGALTAGRADVRGSLRAGAVKAAALSVGKNLSVAGDAELGGVSVGAEANFGGSLSATTIHADSVVIGAGNVSARGIQGRSRVVIGAAKLTVDAVLAPDVRLDPRTSGRVTVVESLNEVGPSAIKGGFRLADYAEMFGDSATFLAERGLTALGDAPAAAAPHVEEAAEEPAGESSPEPVEAEPRAETAWDAPVEPAAEPAAAASLEEEPPTGSQWDEAPTGEGAAVEAAPVEPEVQAWEPPATVAVEETTDPESIEAGEADAEAEAEAAAQQEERSGPAMVSIPQYSAPMAAAEPEPEPVAETSYEPVVEPEAEPASEPAVEAAPEPAVDEGPPVEIVAHPLHGQLVSTIQRIVDCYANAELPGAVERLRTLAEARAYPEIRAEITNIWSELLKYHQKKGIRIHPMVTTTFNSVNSLVKKM